MNHLPTCISQRNDFLRRFAAPLFALGLLTASSSAFAMRCWPNHNVRMNFPSELVLDTETPVGGVLLELNQEVRPNSGGQGPTRCTFNGAPTPVGDVHIVYGNFTDGPMVHLGDGIYTTGIEGVGIRTELSGGRPTHGANTSVPRVAPRITSDSLSAFTAQLKIQFIRTGPTLGNGNLRIGSYTPFVYGYLPFAISPNNNIFGIIFPSDSVEIPIGPPDPTCNFTVNEGRDVDLRRHDASVFTGVGSASSWETFNITSAGCNASVTRVNMSWRGTADAEPGLFQVSGDARGVAIEVQRADTNIQITPNGPAQPWTQLGTAQTYPHRARFVQTLPDIAPGAASTAITINITYN